jgi:hypothetical protein
MASISHPIALSLTTLSLRVRLVILLACIGLPALLRAQTLQQTDTTVAVGNRLAAFIYMRDTVAPKSVGMPYSYRWICKGPPIGNAAYETGPGLQQPISVPVTMAKRIKLLQVTGNVLYDVNYRSRIDTPYAEKDVYQHTIQTRLDIVYKEQYPFRIYLTTRFSNSSFFRKYTDFNLGFNPGDFKRMMKARAMQQVESFLAAGQSRLDSLKQIIAVKRKQISALDDRWQKPDLQQQLVEQREKNLYKPVAPAPLTRLPAVVWNDRTGVDSLSADSTKGDIGDVAVWKDSLAAGKKKLDSLVKELERLEDLQRRLTGEQAQQLAEWRKKMEDARDVNALAAQLKQMNAPDSILPRGYKFLSALQSVNIGRSTADYSELSVRNISITGLQVEYNPRFYYAIAAGRVDYRFRDYIVPAHNRSRQYVALARFGKGTKEGNHIFFTYYTGKRQFFNSSTTSPAGSPVPEYALAGITIEGAYKITPHIFLTGEVAKSTIPYYSQDSLQRSNKMNAITKWSDRSNEAYAVRLQGYFPRSQTRIMGNMRYTGANFQSFSTFTTGAAQWRWKGRIEQPFFKKQLTLISSLEQNDYTNPFVTTAYKTSAVMASLQANLRIKKWPVVSLGYYPSFQLVKTGEAQYAETRYYTLSGSVGYFYKTKEAILSTYILYSQFYNQANDSGFVYYNARNWLLSQNVLFDRFSLTLNAAYSANTDYTMFTWENAAQLTISKVISAGVGIKLIRHNLVKELQFGYSGQLSFTIPYIGQIQLMMDKGFIPGMNRLLAENKMGRLTYYKTF